ncbi:sensor histidine kinase [Kitasatospora cathayae]|uniref:histidine kinase n=1 Tax=Kitasatospora cathayae TaxID=3004092 RepID=A0ABY7Q1C7_9ACTN|nr:histidine kinase [Kitasatospora sp. HUAS 3-15]WBP85956.1 histidine kinase [Kitasatospora sp. HUAS 3-15]
MTRILAPLVAGASYARLLHLLVGWIFAGVILMIYPGTYQKSLGAILVTAVSLDVVVLALVALVPAARRAEGVQARLLLVPDREEDVGVESSRTWADRRRTAGWLIGRVVLGSAVGFSTVFGLAPIFDLLTGPRAFWYLPLAPVLAVGFGWLVVWAGRLQLAMAVRLLGPSPAERLAEAELRAERLLERNRLARELHDSIGHALTVTVLQAGAAREVGDPAFAAKALEVIEETGRQAMEDLERTLVLLRETPAGGAARNAVATEQPGIDQLPALFDTARAAGSPVEASIEVPAGVLPGVLSRESYRIVQEGVTNALKYAPGQPVEVQVAVRDGQLELRCANRLVAAPGRGGGSRKGGKGLRGIRERAVLLGGAASAGPADRLGPPAEGTGEWVLDVRLPLRLGS